VAIMAFESDYTHFTRVAFFGTGGASAQTAILGSQTSGSEHYRAPLVARLEILRNPTRPFGLLRSSALAPHSKTAKTGAWNKLLNEYLLKRDFAHTPEPPPEPGGHAARSSSSGGSELHAE
jgi:hypothetical protein